MGWIRDGMEDHEGFVAMVVRDDWRWRELGIDDRAIPTDEHGYKVQHRLQVGCECGWRSERFVAPLGTDWAPCSVVLPDEETEDAAALYWSEMHMDRLSESAPGTLLRRWARRAVTADATTPPPR